MAIEAAVARANRAQRGRKRKTGAALADPAGPKLLRRADPILGKLIDAVSRLQERFGGHLPSPQQLLAVDPQELRASGMSNRKGATLRAIAERFVGGRDGPGSRAMAPLSKSRGQLSVRVRVRVGNLMRQGKVKSVGIIGAGRLGQAMAQTAKRAGRHVVMSNSRGPQSLTSLVQELGKGVSAGTVKDAAAADVVVLAVMWPDVPKAVDGLEWDGRIVVDATNDFDPSNLDGRTSSEVVADLLGSARVVKAANTLQAAILGSNPHQAGGKRVIFVSGNDADAKSEVVALFEDAGFFVIDLGGLREGGIMQQVGAPLAGHNMIRLP